MIIYQPVRQTDLEQVYDVFYQNEIHDTPVPPPPGEVPSDLYHILETGSIYMKTFLSTASTPFFDARCYISSGSNLF